MSNSKEVEIRIFLQARKKIEEKVKKSGAKLAYFSHLKDYWFCPQACKNYKQASTDKTGFALRIRESQDIYTGKKTASLDCKTLCDGKNHALCNEYEVDLSDTDQARRILESIGLKEFLLIDKKRIIYQLRDIKFCFDEIKGLGDGLEIEVMTKGNVKTAHAGLMKIAEELGVDKKDILEKSLTYMAMEKISKF